MLATILTIIAAIISGSGANFISGWFNRRKNKSESDYLQSKAAKIYDDLSKEWIKRLEAEARKFEQEVARLTSLIKDMLAQCPLGIDTPSGRNVPCWIQSNSCKCEKVDDGSC